MQTIGSTATGPLLRPAAVAAAIGLLVTVGCNTVRRGATSVPQAAPAEIAVPLLQMELIEPRAAGDESSASLKPLLEEPQLDERSSTAPHDDLAGITPELSSKKLKRERRLAQARPAEFDIPIVRNEQVMFWLDYYSNRRSKDFQAGLVRSGRYVDMFRRIFNENGLPRDLVYMAHVESGYKTSAYSRARATGIFQFIAATGRHYGLRIDYWVDERRDPEKSARAATAYLKDLHDEFGDWYLALAGYNAGEGRVRRAVVRSKSRDFWTLKRYLRRETRNYVPAILAAVLISREPEKYGFDFEPDDAVRYDTIEVGSAVDLRVLGECAGAEFETLKRLNPALRRYQTPPRTRYAVHVPRGSGEKTLAALEQVPTNERVVYVRHRVRRGDTLSDLADEYRVSVRAIQSTNGMGRRTMIREGRTVLIPTPAARRFSASATPVAVSSAPSGQPLTYRVRRSDTLYGIARRYRTTPTAIASVNGVRVNDVLSIGKTLTVVPGARSSAVARRIVAEGSTIASRESRVVHTVRGGDTLWGIATRYQTTVARLCSLNRISSRSTLYPGTTLTVFAE